MTCKCEVCERNYRNIRADKPYAVDYSYMGNRGIRLEGIYYTYYLTDVFGFADMVRGNLGEVRCDISRNL